MTKLMLPTGLENVPLGQSMLPSKLLGLCSRKYQGLGPVNCKNTKYFTRFRLVELFKLTVDKFINWYTLFKIFPILNPGFPNM